MLAQHYFPQDKTITAKRLGEALYLEKRYWERMQESVTAGINKAFSD